jgi:Holliday junction resolvase RusA-like endonuclease
MNNEIELHIPLAALSKKNKMRYWKGRVLKDGRIREYEIKLTKALLAYDGEVLECPVDVELTFCWKDNRRRDLQNALDVILDVAQGIIYKDDVQIRSINCRKISGAPVDKIIFKIKGAG